MPGEDLAGRKIAVVQTHGVAESERNASPEDEVGDLAEEALAAAKEDPKGPGERELLSAVARKNQGQTTLKVSRDKDPMN